MDGDRFDTLSRALAMVSPRRAILATLLATVLGRSGAADPTAARQKPQRRHPRNHPQKRNHPPGKDKRRHAAAEGPCGNGSAKANACKRDGQCCTGYCDKRKDRCRCKKLGRSCTEDRNCCASFGQPMTCQNQTCQTVASSPPPPSVVTECQPEPVAQTCAGRCQIVPNNCGNPIDCGPCACTPPCPICQSCSGGVCSPDPARQGTVCAGSFPATSICCKGTCWDGCCDADGLPGFCQVFVTSGPRLTGDLGGLTGADAICQQKATHRTSLPPLPGTYKAWLSTGTGPDQSPATGRFRQSGQEYVRVDGALIANNWADLIDGTLANPIQIDENLDDVGGTEVVWTNTDPDGTEWTSDPQDCGDWEEAVDGLEGAIGVPDRADVPWTHAFVELDCHIHHSRLYCFQQE